MDSFLLGQAVQKNGPILIRNLKEENQDFPENVVHYLSKYREKPPQFEDLILREQICSFASKKADFLFVTPPEKTEKDRKPPDYEDTFAKMPPLETFMGIPEAECRRNFFNSIEKHDVVIGVVNTVLDSGLVITLLCLDDTKSRDIDQLRISAFCPVKELPKLFPNQDAIEGFQVRDKVRAIVLNVNPETEKLIVSMVERSLPDDKADVKLALINEDDFPVQFRRKLHIRGLTFDELLHSILGFNNSGNIEYLLDMLDQEENLSLMRGLHGLKIPEKETAESLRRYQSQKMAHSSVAQGISHFKAGRQPEAIQCFNKALDIDKSNVEALVARGALYANNESFNRAIDDFEDAIKINSSHANARKYLHDTLLAFGKSKEDIEKYEEAEELYIKAISLDTASVEAREALRFLHYRRHNKQPDVKRVSSPREERRSRSPNGFEQTAKTLKKLIKGEDKRHRKRRRRRSDDKSSSSSGSSSSHHRKRRSRSRGGHRNKSPPPNERRRQKSPETEEEHHEYGVDLQSSFLSGAGASFSDLFKSSTQETEKSQSSKEVQQIPVVGTQPLANPYIYPPPADWYGVPPPPHPDQAHMYGYYYGHGPYPGVPPPFHPTGEYPPVEHQQRSSRDDRNRDHRSRSREYRSRSPENLKSRDSYNHYSRSRSRSYDREHTKKRTTQRSRSGSYDDRRGDRRHSFDESQKDPQQRSSYGNVQKYRRISRSPSYEKSAKIRREQSAEFHRGRSPGFKSQDSKEYRKKLSHERSEGPDFRGRTSCDHRRSRSPGYDRKQSHSGESKSPNYMGRSKSPDYRDQSNSPDYRARKKSPGYRQTARSNDMQMYDKASAYGFEDAQVEERKMESRGRRSWSESSFNSEASGQNFPEMNLREPEGNSRSQSPQVRRQSLEKIPRRESKEGSLRQSIEKDLVHSKRKTSVDADEPSVTPVKGNGVKKGKIKSEKKKKTGAGEEKQKTKKKKKEGAENKKKLKKNIANETNSADDPQIEIRIIKAEPLKNEENISFTSDQTTEDIRRVVPKEEMYDDVTDLSDSETVKRKEKKRDDSMDEFLKSKWDNEISPRDSPVVRYRGSEPGYSYKGSESKSRRSNSREFEGIRIHITNDKFGKTEQKDSNVGVVGMFHVNEQLDNPNVKGNLKKEMSSDRKPSGSEKGLPDLVKSIKAKTEQEQYRGKRYHDEQDRGYKSKHEQYHGFKPKHESYHAYKSSQSRDRGFRPDHAHGRSFKPELAHGRSYKPKIEQSKVYRSEMKKPYRKRTPPGRGRSRSKSKTRGRPQRRSRSRHRSRSVHRSRSRHRSKSRHRSHSKHRSKSRENSPSESKSPSKKEPFHQRSNFKSVRGIRGRGGFSKTRPVITGRNKFTDSRSPSVSPGRKVEGLHSTTKYYHRGGLARGRGGWQPRGARGGHRSHRSRSRSYSRSRSRSRHRSRDRRTRSPGQKQERNKVTDNVQSKKSNQDEKDENSKLKEMENFYKQLKEKKKEQEEKIKK